jgi:hypothetical protein
MVGECASDCMAADFPVAHLHFATALFAGHDTQLQKPSKNHYGTGCSHSFSNMQVQLQLEVDAYLERSMVSISWASNVPAPPLLACALHEHKCTRRLVCNAMLQC